MRKAAGFQSLRKLAAFHLLPENIALISSGNIISKDNDVEAGFIKDININISDKIEAHGAFISKMLGFRIITYSSENKVNLKTAADQILQSNFISGAAAWVIPRLGIAAYMVNIKKWTPI